MRFTIEGVGSMVHRQQDKVTSVAPEYRVRMRSPRSRIRLQGFQGNWNRSHRILGRDSESTFHRMRGLYDCPFLKAWQQNEGVPYLFARVHDTGSSERGRRAGIPFALVGSISLST